MITMKYTALITIAAAVYTFMLSGRVGGLRGELKISAPATTGHDQFERAFRVHYNTIEQFVLFVPLLWMASAVVGDLWAAAVGSVWLLGRFVYSSSYMNDPSKRTRGMLITVFPMGVLAIASLWGVVKAFIG